MPEVYINIPRLIQKEGSSFSATAFFRNGQAASVPTTAKYRIDCLKTGKVLQDWTSLTVAVSIAIPITATHNAIQDQSNRYEKKQITVAADPDTATQVRESIVYKIENIRNF